MKMAISIPDELDIGGIIWEGAEEHASLEEAVRALDADTSLCASKR
jgi:hypothetical protein